MPSNYLTEFIQTNVDTETRELAVKSKLASIGLILLTVCDTANAHPGHGTVSSDGVWHYMTSPAHAIPALLIGLIAAAAVSKIARAVVRRSNDER